MMTAGIPVKTKQTVILAADASSYSIPIVNLAVEIAAAVDSKLQGLFIEDEDLLLLSGLPCTREITLTTASERHTSVVQMQRLLQSVARQFEQTLQQEAQSFKIAWSYEYVRGRVRDVGLKTRLEAACTILARGGPRRYQPGRGERTHRILLVGGHSIPQSQALSVLLRHYGAARIEITSVEDAGDSGAAPDMPGPLQHPVGNISLIQLDREQAFERLVQLGPGFDYAIVSIHEKLDDLMLIINTLQCPIILVA